jgi:hypothetical protein
MTQQTKLLKFIILQFEVYCGISEQIVNGFDIYLSDTSQKVVVDGFTSSRTINSGVPQTSF